MAILQKLVTADYLVPDGAGSMVPISGKIRFIPSATVYDAEGNIVTPPQPITIDLVAGVLQVNLLVTDDPDTNPTDWTWLVTELFPGGREYAIQLPTAGGTTVDLTTLAPVETIESTFAYASLGALAALQAQVDALEVDAGVRHVVEFVSSGTWTCPAGITAVDQEIIGAGGGAGGGGGGSGGIGNAIVGFGGGGAGGGGGGSALHRRLVAVPVTPGNTYAVVVGAAGVGGAGGTAGVAGTASSGGSAPVPGGDGGNGTDGGFSEAVAIRAFGGRGGEGGYGGTYNETAQDETLPSGGNYSGGLGGGGSASTTYTGERNGSAGGSFGAVGGHPFGQDATTLDSKLQATSASRGEASPIVNDETPGGGAGGGGGGRGAAGTTGVARGGGNGGTGGQSQSGGVGGIGGIAGADATNASVGANNATPGTAGTSGDAANHKGAGGNGGGGGGGGGGASTTGSPRVGGAGGAGGGGSNGGAGVVRIIY